MVARTTVPYRFLYLRGYKMKNENYITIQGWMRNGLNLKGNELMVYALIYGFSQDNETQYTGSVGYIADWIGSTKQTVHNVLKSLCEKKLLIKQEEYRNGIKFCSYIAVLPVVKNFDWVVKKFDGGSKKFLPNNIDNNTNNNIEYIVKYLNEKTGKNYKSETGATKKLINARLKEGFTVEDFKKVIDNKVASWKGDPKMDGFLRPQTLFGNKFESYLNENPVKPQAKKNSFNNFTNSQSYDFADIEKRLLNKGAE